MATSLVRCPSCGVHLHADARRCPFCSSSRGLPMKRLVGTMAGVAAFVSGIGCGYGCPADTCGDVRYDAGLPRDSSSDTANHPDVSVTEAGGDTGASDAPAEAFTDAPGDAPADALPDSPADALVDAPSDALAND